jgi:hypothetical protein
LEAEKTTEQNRITSHNNKSETNLTIAAANNFNKYFQKLNTSHQAGNNAKINCKTQSLRRGNAFQHSPAGPGYRSGIGNVLYTQLSCRVMLKNALQNKTKISISIENIIIYVTLVRE